MWDKAARSLPGKRIGQWGGGGVGMCVHVSPCSLLALCGHGPLPAPEPGLIKHFQLEGMAGLHPVRVRFI